MLGTNDDATYSQHTNMYKLGTHMRRSNRFSTVAVTWLPREAGCVDAKWRSWFGVSFAIIAAVASFLQEKVREVI